MNRCGRRKLNFRFRLHAELKEAISLSDGEEKLIVNAKIGPGNPCNTRRAHPFLQLPKRRGDESLHYEAKGCHEIVAQGPGEESDGVALVLIFPDDFSGEYREQPYR